MTQTTSLTLQKEQLEKIQQNISHYSDVTSHILHTHTDHEVVAMGGGCIPTELKATIMEVENMSPWTSQYGPITADVQLDALMKELSMFGCMYQQSPVPCKSEFTIQQSVMRRNTKCLVKLEARMLNGERYPHGGVQVEAEMRSKAHDGAVVYGEVEDHRDGTYTITLTPQTVGPHQLVITMDGQHVQNSPHYLDVTYSLTLCNAQQVIRCSRPLCVAIHDNGDIYVGSWDDCIYVFDQTGQLKNTIGSEGSGDGQFRCPSGISIKGDVLYVADRDNYRIQKLTSRGEFINKFSQKGSSQVQLYCPRAVIVDSNNRLIVSDCGNHRIQIFNEGGGWLLTIYGDGKGTLALDPQGNIHAAFSTSIEVFTKEGVYVRTYGYDSLAPRSRGIAIDDEGNAFVSHGRCLSMFDHHGNKIHEVGNFSRSQGYCTRSQRW